MKTLTVKDVEFKIECLPEDMPVRGNACSIDPEADRECEDKILEDLDSGNPWAWCVVRVTATYKGIRGVDYLGGCCYASEEDFKQPNGYYDDMKANAFDDLKKTIADLKAKVCGVAVS